MDKYIYNESNGLWYERCGDYYLPCLTMHGQNEIGIWGQQYLRYLKKHKYAVYEDMRLNGTLANHVIEIDQQAQEMFDLMAKQMAAQKGVTELLKASDQMAWIGAINGIRKIVEELVLEELIYI